MQIVRASWPVDFGGQVFFPEIYKRVLEEVLEDENVDQQLKLLEQQGIPIYPSQERAMKSVSILYQRYFTLKNYSSSG